MAAIPAISVDTMVLIWGVKKVANHDQQEMIARAVYFINDLKDKNIRIVTAAHAVAEYLGAFSPQSRQSQREVLYRDFIIAPFDAKAADIAADLLYQNEPLKQMQKEYGVTRQVLKADLAIIASSVAVGCSHIYSNEKRFEKMARGKIIVESIPSLPDNNSGDKTNPGTLFDE